MNCQKTIPLSDLARINNQRIILKQINLEQVKALWANRLYPIHAQANPKPSSPIAPLSEQKLEDKYPGGKANLRASLSFGGILYEKYKYTSSIKIPESDDKTLSQLDCSTAFKLLWQDELNQTENKITRLRQLSSPELIEMLMSAMSVLGIKQIKPKPLSGTYSNYSLSYQSANQSQVGILWNEDSNLKSFANFIKAGKRLIESKHNISLTMIRSESVGKRNNRGYQIYEKIFNDSSHRHIKASLESVHYLKTYQKLVNDARSGDLVLNFQPLNLENLEKLVRETKILHQCDLLQDLGIIFGSYDKKTKPEEKTTKLFTEEKDFLLNLVKHHHLLGQEILIKQAKTQFTEVEKVKIETLIQELIKEHKISIINPNAKAKERLICLIPQAVVGAKK